jgi:Tripartite tricarboxylate transporter family receptor
MCNGIPEAGQHIQARTLKAYALGTVERNRAIPNVPTSKEAGLPEFQAAPWFALFAPKGTPQAIRDMLSESAKHAASPPQYRRTPHGCRMIGLTPPPGQKGNELPHVAVEATEAAAPEAAEAATAAARPIAIHATAPWVVAPSQLAMLVGLLFPQSLHPLMPFTARGGRDTNKVHPWNAQLLRSDAEALHLEGSCVLLG